MLFCGLKRWSKNIKSPSCDDVIHAPGSNLNVRTQVLYDLFMAELSTRCWRLLLWNHLRAAAGCLFNRDRLSLLHWIMSSSCYIITHWGGVCVCVNIHQLIWGLYCGASGGNFRFNLLGFRVTLVVCGRSRGARCADQSPERPSAFIWEVKILIRVTYSLLGMSWTQKCGFLWTFIMKKPRGWNSTWLLKVGCWAIWIISTGTGNNGHMGYNSV